VDRIFYGEPHPYRTSLSHVRVNMMIMCILGVELLYQADIFQYSSVCYQTHVNTCDYVLSYLALNGFVIR
jgi:hypothetical protein